MGVGTHVSLLGIQNKPKMNWEKICLYVLLGDFLNERMAAWVRDKWQCLPKARVFWWPLDSVAGREQQEWSRKGKNRIMVLFWGCARAAGSGSHRRLLRSTQNAFLNCPPAHRSRTTSPWFLSHPEHEHPFIFGCPWVQAKWGPLTSQKAWGQTARDSQGTHQHQVDGPRCAHNCPVPLRLKSEMGEDGTEGTGGSSMMASLQMKPSLLLIVCMIVNGSEAPAFWEHHTFLHIRLTIKQEVLSWVPFSLSLKMQLFVVYFT